MSSTYEIWLCDDQGRRLHLIEKFSSLSYSRTTQGYGTCQLLLPYEKYVADIGPAFKPDWRLDIWRSPMTGIPARREGSFLLRKFSLYERLTDHFKVIELFGRCPLDILRRQSVKFDGIITFPVDDFMKYIVTSRFASNPSALSTSPTTYNGGVYTYTGEFVVDAFSSDGPLVSNNFYLKNVLDVCKNLKAASASLNEQASTNRKIYFDVVEDDSLVSNGFGYRFRTYPDLRGKDRTKGIIFSTENGNLAESVYYEDYLDQVTSEAHYNTGQTWSPQRVTSNEQYLSRWNFIEELNTTSENVANADLTNLNEALRNKASRKVLNASFLNSPGSSTQPRSLYGVDWDMGDLLPAAFGGRVLSTEVVIVYVSLNDQGKETISGKTQVGTL